MSTQPSATLPFELSVPPQTPSQDVTDDPWAIAPGSYLNASKPEAKISSIPPLSLPPMDDKKQASLRAITHPSPEPEAPSPQTEASVSETPQDDQTDAPQEKPLAAGSSDTPGVPTLTSDLSVVETLRQVAFGKGQEAKSEADMPSAQKRDEPERSSDATSSTPSSEPEQAAAASEQEPSPHPQQNPNWPSPLLYPMRSPAKKERSNSAIDLPAFLR